MAEAEDVVVDIARHATVYFRNLWLKCRPPIVRPQVALKDVSERLELLLLSAFQRSFLILVSQPPMPPTLMARTFRHAQFPWQSDAIPGNDGTNLWLPAALNIDDSATAQLLYRTMAFQQAIRAQRASIYVAKTVSDPLLRDLFLLIEANASDFALMLAFPGLTPGIELLRHMMLDRRPALSQFSDARKPLEQLYRGILKDWRATSVLLDSPEESLRKAKALLSTALGTLPHYTVRTLSAAPLLKDWWTGDWRPLTQHSTTLITPNKGSTPEDPAKSGRMVRSPDVRRASDDEDKPRKNQDAWMVQGDESHSKAEDPMGLQRPVDRDQDTDAAEFADMVSELAQARLISSPGSAREILLSDDAINKQSQLSSRFDATKHQLNYPEWDYLKQAYQVPGASVHVGNIHGGSQLWVDKTLAHYRPLINLIQRHFEILRAKPVLQRRQYDGDDLDLDAYVTSYSDFCAGDSFNDALYLTRRTRERNFAITLLIDISGSTDSWIGQTHRVIDVEREALLLVAIALQTLGEPYSILAFSGKGKRAVEIREVKTFAEKFSTDIALRISALEPERFTRVGAALRHASCQLMATQATHRLLILLSDGKPNDNDFYEGRFGIEDTRHAVIEAKNQGINTFCLTIDRHATDYMPTMFGPRHYALLRDVEQLPTALLEWLKRLLSL